MAIVIADCADCGVKITTVGLCQGCGADAERQAVDASPTLSEEFLPPVDRLFA